MILSWKIIFTAFALCSGVGLLFRNKFNRFISFILPLCAFLLGLGLASYQANSVLNARITNDHEGKELLITGTVTGIPSVRDDGTRFILDVDKASLANDPKQSVKLEGLVRLGWFNNAKALHSDELWQLKVKLKRPSGFMNPGGFDYEKWLFTQKIIATGYVRNTKQSDQQSNRIIAPNSASNYLPSYLHSFDRIRQNIHSHIQFTIQNKPSAAVLSALLVAVRDKLDETQWQLLQATGTSHLIAISGLHIAVVAGFAFFPMMFLWRLFPRLNQHIPVQVAGAVVGTLFAAGYALLAGFTLPTQRALLMVIIGLWGLVSRRNFDAFTILAFALVLVLLWDPLAPLTVSFWLSFLAVFLILFFIKRQKAKPRWMVIKLQLFLSLAMLPLTLLFFGNASLTSPVANLFAIPWVSLIVVPISLLALIALPFSTFLSTKLLELGGFTIELLFKGLSLIGSSPLSDLSFADTPASLLVIAFIGLLCLFLPKGFPARFLGLLMIFPAFVYQGYQLKENEFTYTLLDVGQGYASVLKTQNYTLIYDAGTRVSESFDMGKLVIAPYLQAQGIKTIDTLMISHEDVDHRGGAQYLIDHLNVKEVLSSDNSLLAESRACITGQQWQWDGVNFEVLSPARFYLGNDNDRSCVLKVWNKTHSLLLTGDIHKKTEKKLIEAFPNKLKASVLSVPHHGSKTSSSIAFIEKVSPEIALISAGYRSRFGHPKPSVVKRYENAGVELLDTVNHGAISLYFPANEKEIRREYYRIENQGIWSRK